ncbi:MAG: hypothetical protein ABIO04_05890 [Ferruginibacter sp.]
MKKKNMNTFPDVQQTGEKRSVIMKFRIVLMGKDFHPLPSYWAIVPAEQENILKLKKKK